VDDQDFVADNLSLDEIKKEQYKWNRIKNLLE
jgi:hypothetical protein